MHFLFSVVAELPAVTVLVTASV
jgi:structure-specific recognition protein 1